MGPSLMILVCYVIPIKEGGLSRELKRRARSFSKFKRARNCDPTNNGQNCWTAICHLGRCFCHARSSSRCEKTGRCVYTNNGLATPIHPYVREFLPNEESFL